METYLEKSDLHHRTITIVRFSTINYKKTDNKGYPIVEPGNFSLLGGSECGFPFLRELKYSILNLKFISNLL